VILPSKHIPPNRALLTIGAEILRVLERSRSVSAVWGRLRGLDSIKVHGHIGYSWFVLALDLLFMIDAVYYKNGTLHRSRA
jgi:hypothetical protein